MIHRYSSIQTAYTCYQKYKYIYVDGVEERHNSADMAFGSSFHKGIEAYFNKYDPLEALELDWLKNKDNESLVYTRFNWADLNEIGKVLIERWLKMYSKKLNVIKFEETMTVDIGGYQIGGTPDYIGEYLGKTCIIDFKTSAREYDKSKIISNEQLYIYSLMAEKNLGLTIDKIGYMVFIKDLNRPRIQANVFMDLNRELMKINIDNVEKMCRDLNNRKEFPMNKNSCHNCSFFEKCYGQKK